MQVHEEEPGKPFVEIEYEIRTQYDRMIQTWEFIIAKNGKFPPGDVSIGIDPNRHSAHLDFISAPEIGFEQEGSERGGSEEPEDDSVKSEESTDMEDLFLLYPESCSASSRLDREDSDYLPSRASSIPAESRRLRARRNISNGVKWASPSKRKAESSETSHKRSKRSDE